MNSILKDALSSWRAVRAALFLFACAFSLRAQPAAPVSISPDTQVLSSTASPEEVKLSAKGAFLTDHAAVGDTVDYSLIVEWQDARVPVVVLPPESLETPGFRIASQSTTHRKTAENGEARNATEFLYRLVAKTPGSAKVAPLKLRYVMGFSNREDALYVPGSFLEVHPARIPLWKQAWFEILALIFAIAGLFWGGRRLLRASALKRKQAAVSKQRDFAPEVKNLKGRWNTAESRIWIDDAEKVCVTYLRHTLGQNSPETARFEVLLDQFLALHPGRESTGWNQLRGLFHEARYAGGNKQPHELQDTYRVIKTCLHIQED